MIFIRAFELVVLLPWLVLVLFSSLFYWAVPSRHFLEIEDFYVSPTGETTLWRRTPYGTVHGASAVELLVSRSGTPGCLDAKTAQRMGSIAAGLDGSEYTKSPPECGIRECRDDAGAGYVLDEFQKLVDEREPIQGHLGDWAQPCIDIAINTGQPLAADVTWWVNPFSVPWALA